MSLRLRISLAITLVIVVFTLTLAQMVLKDMRDSIREESESATQVAVQIIETVVASVYREPGPAERNPALVEFLRRAGRVHGNDIRLYDAQGTLLYQSPPPTYRAGSSAPEWFARLVRPNLDTSRLALPSGSIVVVPEPSRSVLEAWDNARVITAVALIFLLLINAVVFWHLDRSLRPLPSILEGLARMGRGELQVRLPAFRSAEFGSISAGFNRMAQALEEMQAAERALEQNRRFTAAVQSQIEEERRALARELHDELGQCVTAIKTIGTAIASRAGESTPDIRDNARTIVSVASHIYDVMHGIIRRLRPSGLDHLGLAETLRGAVASFAQRHPDIQWDLELRGELDGLGEAVNITVYRIVQETLTNAVRHAEATRVRVLIDHRSDSPDGDTVTVLVQDNGKGLAAPEGPEERAGFGLEGMRERVQAFGGSFEIRGAASASEGVTVRAVIPLARSEPVAQLEEEG